MSLGKGQWGVVLDCLCGRHHLDWFAKDTRVCVLSNE